MNVNKLKGKMVECGLKVDYLANKLCVDKATFYRRLALNGETFTIKEADILARELQLSANEVNSIFFSQYVA